MEVQILKQHNYNFLWISDELWMWDIPIERCNQMNIAKKASGDVLVVGHGLGIIHRYLLINKKIKSITTVEKHIEVITECKRVGIKIKGSLLIDDFFKLPENSIYVYDCIIGDIWTDIVPESLEDYIKFKEKALTLLKPEGKILAWGQDYFEYLIEKENK